MLEQRLNNVRAQHKVDTLCININKLMKLCVRCFTFFHQIIAFKKIMKNALNVSSKKFFIFNIFRCSCFHLPLFFPCQPLLPKIIKINFKVYDVINWLDKNLKILIWYLEKERRSDFETWPIDRVSNKENLYGKSIQKMSTKS